MKAARAIEDLRRTHNNPAWRLLRADYAPEIIGILKTMLYDKERRLLGSVLAERIAQQLDWMHSRGMTMAQGAQQYVYQWLHHGFLQRRLHPGDAEDSYELTPGAIDAIRFAFGLERPQTAATESRLALVVNALVDLADQTDADKARRIDRLEEQKADIQREIDAILSSGDNDMRTLPHVTAIERVRDIIALTEDLLGDFQHIRESYLHVHRTLQDRVASHEGSQSEVLQEVFDGLSQVAASDAGRTFAAFWAMLDNEQQTTALDRSIEDVLSRPFASAITPAEKRFLRDFKRALLARNAEVQREFGHFSASLRSYVQRRDYSEQRRINKLILEAQRAAMTARDLVGPWEPTGIVIELPTVRCASPSRLVMADPMAVPYSQKMTDGQQSKASTGDIARLLSAAEINFDRLREQIGAALADCDQATVADILKRFPPEQGLGSVLGMLTFAHRYGVRGDESSTEEVEWVGSDGTRRRGTVPVVYFTKEKFNASRTRSARRS